jgi:hypothetical protein
MTKRRVKGKLRAMTLKDRQRRAEYNARTKRADKIKRNHKQVPGGSSS